VTARFALGVLLLVLQVAGIVRGRFVDDRYFCWAPFDQVTRYSISVWVGDAALTPREIFRRYRREPVGVDNRAAYHVLDVIERVERSAAEPARVVVRYRVNGREEREWRYPR
jgi:hypothetical protein